MKKTSKILSLFLTLIMVISIIPMSTITASAETSGKCGDNLTWYLDDEAGSLYINGVGPMYDYLYSEIPWKDYAESIRYIYIGDDVSTICNDAFGGFEYVGYVEIGKNLTKIGRGAFAYTGWNSYSGYLSVSIPVSVKEIGSYAFGDCPYIEVEYYGTEEQWNAITIGTENEPLLYGLVTFIGSTNNPSGKCGEKTNWEFDQSTGTLTISGTGETLGYAENFIPWERFQRDIKKVDIKDGATTIGDYAFNDCFFIESVSIPDSVTSIGAYSFGYCTSLESVTIPNGVTTIGLGAFYDSGLEDITLPLSVTKIGNYAFYGCTFLSNVEYIGTQGQWNSISIGLDNDKLLNATINFNPSGICGENLTWRFEESTGTLTISGYGPMKLIVDINGTKVPWASYKNSILSIVIEEGVTTICGDAFHFCSNLAEVAIPDSITSIGYCAFYQCSGITDVYYSGSNSQWDAIEIAGYNDSLKNATIHCIPSTYSVQYHANGGTGTMENDTFTVGEKDVLSKNAFKRTGYTFAGWSLSRTSSTAEFTDQATILDLITAEQTITLYAVWKPNTYYVHFNANGGIGTMDDQAFEYGKSQALSPNNFTKVGYTFLGWSKSSTASSVTYSDQKAVKNLSNIDGATINLFAVWEKAPVTVNNIFIGTLPTKTKYRVNDTFDATGLTVKANMTDGTVRTITGYTLSTPDMTTSGKKVVTVIYGDATVTFTINVFEEKPSGACGENVTWEFDESTGTLTISGTGDMYSNPADDNWDYLKEDIKTVVIGDDVTFIGRYAFENCKSLANVTIGNSVTRIGNGAFKNCLNLTSVAIPDSVTIIGDSAFESCNKLMVVSMGNDVTVIGDVAFNNCISLESITFNEKLTYIGEGAFIYTNLKNVNIPAGVETIGMLAFAGCQSLESITVDSDNPYFTSDEFGVLFNKDKTTLVQYPIGNARICYTLPDSVKIIGDGAFGVCTKLTSIIIPNSLTSIGEVAFVYCEKLTDVYYSGTEEEWNNISIDNTDNSNAPLLNATIHYNYDPPFTGIDGDYFYIVGVKQKAYQLVEFEGDFYFINDYHKIAKNKRIYLSQKFVDGFTYEDGTPLAVGYYEFDENGKMIISNGVIGDYFYKNGVKQKAYQLVEFEGNYYFINDYNKVAKNKRIYLSQKFVEGTDLKVGYYDFDADGKLVLKNGPDGDYFYINGIRQNAYQLVEFEGNFYFINDSHKLAKNKRIYLSQKFVEGFTLEDGTPLAVGYYDFDEDGKLVLLNGPVGDYFYINGVKQKAYQLVEFEGNYYFINDSHKLAKNKRLYMSQRFVEGTDLAVGYYEFDADGKMIIE